MPYLPVRATSLLSDAPQESLETSRSVPTFLLVSIRSALLTNIKFGEGCLFFAMSIVKIRLQKVTLNFHRRNGPRCFERAFSSMRLEKWNRILGIICLLISILTSIKLYYQKASVRTDAGQMPDRCSFFNTV